MTQSKDYRLFLDERFDKITTRAIAAFWGLLWITGYKQEKGEKP
ncbi:MAG: hypothetical protein RBU26_14185 [Sphaerochaeta sp.]|jgi:hypothetical protein|nr:hypothetical protein [Sphaerochaeta sp.]MDX9826070.1 hypothetical protein [Sphaerochaeta sp.]